MKDKTIYTGMVLLSAPVGEYDKRLVILTRERGRITAFARGARKQNSPLLAVCNPFCYGEFEVFEGRTAVTLFKVKVESYFRELTVDPLKASYGFYFLELANFLTRENMEGQELVDLIVRALRALLKNNIPNPLVRSIVELKMLMFNGTYPDVYKCMNCGAKDQLDHYSLYLGGVLCANCGRLVASKQLEVSTIYTMQYIFSSMNKDLFSFKVSKEVQHELEVIIKELMNKYVDHDFISLLML